MPLDLKTNFVLSGLLAATLAFALGGCASLPPAEPDMDPVALEQINRLRSAMERIGTYRMTLETLEDDALPSGQFVQAGQSGVIQVARPDHLSIAVTRDSGEKWAGWFSGDQLVLLDETQKRYARLVVPTPLDKALDELGKRYGLEMPLVDIISGLRRANLLDRVQSGVSLGTESVAGADCHHVLFRQPTVDWQLWIETADPALPRKILLTFKDEPGHPVYQTTITRWDLEPRFSEQDWKAHWPENARQVGIEELLGQEETP